MTPVFWNLIDLEGYFFRAPAYVDVRDLAKAHVRAISQAPPTSEVGRKRLIVPSPHGVDYGRSVDLLRDKRPHLRERLIKRRPPIFDYDRLSIDFDRVEKVLGMRKEDFFTWEEVSDRIQILRIWLPDNVRRPF